MAAKSTRKRTSGKKTEKSSPRGKSAKWLEEDGLLKIAGWARDGCTDETIAKNMGVAYSTLRAWRDRYPALSAALKCAKDVADRKVENKLFERTQGYTIQVKKVFKVKKEHYDEKGRKCVNEELETGVEEVHIPADVTAQIFWLKNRKPEQWRDRIDNSVDFKTPKVEALDDIREEMAKIKAARQS